MKIFFKEKLLGLIKDQLKQGITPKKVALTLALSLVLGIFPILGATTLLCLFVGFTMKLNQPILHIMNYILYPVHILLIPAFIRVGESLFGAPPVPFNLLVWIDVFRKSPFEFLHKFGLAGVHAVAAWCLIAPFVAAITYFIFSPIFQKMSSGSNI